MINSNLALTTKASYVLTFYSRFEARPIFHVSIYIDRERGKKAGFITQDRAIEIFILQLRLIIDQARRLPRNIESRNENKAAPFLVRLFSEGPL